MQPESLPADLAARFTGFQPFAWGATGTLFLGLHAESGQMALLKLLASSLTAEATERARHHRELRKQLGITYPHLPRVLDAGDSGGRIWFIREFVSGDSLLVRLRLRGAMSTPAALAVIAQLASSLDALHRQGIVHRDLKPGHVLFRTDRTGAEVVQLLDAGVSAPLPGRGAEARGTAAYTAPEVVEGGQATFRSDLYALGCLACELLTGTQAFARATVEETLAAQRTDAAPELDAAVPAAVRTLIASLLSKDPRRRPFSAQQVRRSLEPFLPDTVPPAPALPRSSPPPPPPEALGAAADGVRRSAPPPAADGVRRSAPPLGSFGPAPARSDRPRPSAPPIAAPEPAAHSGSSGRRSAPPPSAAGSTRKRSTPPPPPPEALGIAGARRSSVPPASVKPAANGGEKVQPSTRPAPPDATMELRPDELESASTYLATTPAAAEGTAKAASPRNTAKGIGAAPPADAASTARGGASSASSAPRAARAPAQVGTEELDLDALLDASAGTQAPARKLVSRVPTQRSGSLSAPAPTPDAEESAPTIAIDVSAQTAASASRMDELGEAVRSPSAPPPGTAVSGQAASQPAAAATSAAPPPSAAGRSRKSTKMGMGPVRVPAASEPAPAPTLQRRATQSGMAPVGPSPVHIPSTFESAAAAADSAAITGTSRIVAEPPPPEAPASAPRVRADESTIGMLDRSEPERSSRGVKRPLGEHPVVLLWAAGALIVLALGLRMVRGRGPERASSSSVVVLVPEAEPVAEVPQPPAAERTPAEPQPSAAEPSAQHAVEAAPADQPLAAAEPATQAVDSQPPAAAAPEAPAAPAPDRATRDEAPTGGNAAVPAVATVSAAQAGKGFLRDPGSVGAGGLVPYRARQGSDADFKAKARQLFQDGKFREAADAYQKASVRAPSDSAAFAGLGASWLAVGDSDKAIAAYQRAVQLKPEVSGFQAALGRAYLAKGDKARALAAYNKALELDPENQAAKSGAAALRPK